MTDQETRKDDELEREPASSYTGSYVGDDSEDYTDPEYAEAPPVTGTRRHRPARVGAPPASPTYAPPRRGYGCADVITALFLLLSVLVISATVLLIANPRSPLNPFPPPTPISILVLPTPEPTGSPTPTFTPAPPTPTIPTATPTVTATPTATETPTPTNTPVVGGIVSLGEATTTAENIATTPPFTRSPFQFTVKAIRYQPNTGPDGCKWQSIAGAVLNLQGQPRTRDEGSLTVRITGADGTIDEFHYTGEEPRFGESGFEAFLGPAPRVADYTVQLLGITGAPISEKVSIQTRSSCEENVVVIEFAQNY